MTPLPNATVPYWKDWKPGDRSYYFISTIANAGQGTYPTDATSTLKYSSFWTAGTPGLVKLPLEKQGAVAAGSYVLPAFGNRHYLAGQLDGANAYYLNWSSTVTVSSGVAGGYDLYIRNTYVRGGEDDRPEYAWQIRCVAK
jgi:hypothetical protein